MDDWRENTSYIGFSEASQVIGWFWEIVTDMSREDKVQLLQFTTGRYDKHQTTERWFFQPFSVCGRA